MSNNSQIKGLKSLQYLAETSFGTSLSGSTFFAIPAEEIAFTPDREEATPVIHEQTRVNQQRSVMLRNRGTLTFKMWGQGSVTPLTSTATVPTNHLANIIAAHMGGQHVNQGTAVITSTSASLSVDAGEASRFKAGTMCSWNAAGTTTKVSRFLIRVDESADKLWFTLPVASADLPASGSDIYNSVSCYFTEVPSGSLQFRSRERVTTETYYHRGCQGKVSLETEVGQMVKFAFEETAAGWDRADDGALIKQAYTNVRPPPAVIDSVIYCVTGTLSSSNQIYSPTVPVKSKVSAFSVDPGIEWTMDEVTDGLNNVIGYSPTMVHPSAQVTFLQNDASLLAARDNDYPIIFEGYIGSAHGINIVFSLGSAQIHQLK